MDKSRLTAAKGRVKGRALPPPGDFIALGSKSRAPTSSADSELKPLQPLQPKKSSLPSSLSGSSTSTSVHSKEKRKDVPGPLPPLLTSQGLSKHGKSTPTLLSPAPGKSRDSPQQQRTIDVSSPGATVNFIEANPLELENLVLAASENDDNEQVDGLVCMALKTLKTNRLKPDPIIYLSMMSLVKAIPDAFRSKGITEHLLMFLRRESTGTVVKPKPNPLLSVMACNILMYAFQSEENWPESFVKVFVDDALGDRSWVDNEQCKSFVDNILTAFGTVLPSKQSAQSAAEKTKGVLAVSAAGGESGGSSSQPSDEEKILEEFGITVTADESPLVLPRYSSPNVETAIQYYILDVVKDQLTKRSMIDAASRNLLRFLVSVCGYPDVRVLASQRIEAWLQNPKGVEYLGNQCSDWVTRNCQPSPEDRLTRPAQELLMSVAINCNTHMSEDIEVIGNLIKMRLKPKPVANHYIGCIRELLNQHPENLGTTIKHVIYNELSQQRNPNNMPILGVIFQMEPENAAKVYLQEGLMSVGAKLAPIRDKMKKKYKG